MLDLEKKCRVAVVQMAPVMFDKDATLKKCVDLIKEAGKGKAEDAARMAVASPLMETSINGAHGVLINITGSEDMGLEDVRTCRAW